MAFPKRQNAWFSTNQRSAPERSHRDARNQCAKPATEHACQFRRRLSGWCAGRRVKRRRSGVRSSRICRRQPRDGRGRSQNRSRTAGQYRHMSDVADRTGSFRARRVGMPEGGADGYGKNGHQGNHQRRPTKPSKLVVMVTHYRRRTVTLKMLTQTPTAGKRSPGPCSARTAPAQEWVGSGTIERGWRSTAGGSATARGPGSAAGDAACRAGSERSS